MFHFLDMLFSEGVLYVRTLALSLYKFRKALSFYKFRKAVSVILLKYSANIYIYIYVIMKKYPVLKL